MFRLGVIINPLAGLGGSVALKGSDGVAAQALALGAKPQAENRMAQALQSLLPLQQQLQCYCAGGAMGANLLQQLGFEPQLVHQPGAAVSAEDTKATAAELLAEQVDLILFAGGDGTARDIFSVVGERQPVVGVPAGVKIHSGVYAISPSAAGEVAAQMVAGQLVSVTDAEVRDIDEQAFRQGQVRARYFGEMTVPESLRYMQAVKQGGRESEELVLADIAAEMVEQMEPEVQYIMGSGSTVAAVMEELGLPNTLLGVDLVKGGQLIAQDLTAEQLLRACEQAPTKLVVTLIGGQGHLFGRGNQQLSSQLLWQLIADDGRQNNIVVVASKTKLAALDGRPMLADSGDPKLDRALCGHYRIITGYRDAVLYPLANP